eukprot:scaffold43940_cov22-Tisochrysis_lutea.AAC.1
MNVNRFSPGSYSTTDGLRREQVLLNHLVARAYGMTAEDLRRVNTDLEVFWVGKHEGGASASKGANKKQKH